MLCRRYILQNLTKSGYVTRCLSQKLSNAEHNASSTQIKQQIGLAVKPDPHKVDKDYIGPPDTLSNLRPVVRHIPENETPLQTQLREKQNEVEAWNFDFWTRHNKRFYEEKEDFVRLHKLAGITDLSADKMSEFYKTFLDKNRKLHMYYNMSWYLKNLDILVLSFQVQVQKLFSKKKTNK